MDVQVVFDRQDVHRNTGLYSELVAVDRVSGVQRPIAGSERLQDPDVAPDGTTIVAVRERGGVRDLVAATLNRPLDAEGDLAASVEILASGPDTQYGAPRVSPDGRMVVAERRRLGALPDIVVLNLATRAIVASWSDEGARIVTPTWRPDGAAIVAAADFDGGPFDLYEFEMSTADRARRLTHTDGAFWPDVSEAGDEIAFVGYTAAGFDVFVTPYSWETAIVPGPGNTEEHREKESEAKSSADTRRLVPTVASPPPTIEPAVGTRYSPWPTLPPTSWSPFIIADTDQTRLGGTVTGADILTRHSYGVSASWLVSGPSVVRSLAPATPDWAASYAYTRWRPTFFTTVSRQTVFRTVSAALDAETIAGTEQAIEAGVHVPFMRVRQSTQVVAAMVDRETTYRFAQADRSARVVSARLALAHDTTQRYGYSISRERGVNAGTTIDVSRRAFGSQANASTATADVRGYIPGFARHHVLAVRAADGVSWGADLARQTFNLGALAASPSVIDFGSGALGLMRGGLPHTVSGDRILVG
ncbi:MAG: hypothetical protein QM736_07825, partial [Vicinamibacterales bacterium]